MGHPLQRYLGACPCRVKLSDLRLHGRSCEHNPGSVFGESCCGYSDIACVHVQVAAALGLTP